MFSLLQQYFSQFLRAIDDAIARIRDVLADASESPIQDPATPVTGNIIGSVSDGNGLLINVYGEEVGDSVHITVVVEQGVADLRGFFMDVGDTTSGVCVDGVARQDYAIGNESVTSVGARDNNMNGTGETFDVGLEFGTAGYYKDDVSQACFTLEGVTLDQLDGLTFGIRATSVGEDRDDAVKLLGEFDIQEPAAEPAAETPTEPAEPPAGPAEPPAGPQATADSFPDLTDDISSIQLVYNTPAADSPYVVQVSDVPYYAEDDLDIWLIDATHFVEVNDPNVDQNSELLGVAITTTSAIDPTQTPTQYYAMDGDTGADAAPADGLIPDATVTYNTGLGM
jgi:hypothetical protein